VSWERATVEAWIRWRTRLLPVTPLDRVADGVRVKIAGRLDAGEEPLAAPISGRPCAAWSVTVQEWPRRKRTVVEQQMQELVVRDGSSRTALVLATRAWVVLPRDASAWPAQPTAPILAMLRRHGLREDGYFGPVAYRPYRYWEGALAPDETVTVVGVGRLDVDPDGATGSYREPPMRVVFSAAPDAPLWILAGRPRRHRE
jgi:hypothetical protein